MALTSHVDVSLLQLAIHFLSAKNVLSRVWSNDKKKVETLSQTAGRDIRLSDGSQRSKKTSSVVSAACRSGWKENES